MPDLERLRLLAGAATRGPWHPYFTVHGDPYVVPNLDTPLTHRICDVAVSPEDYGRANAEYIAAVSPDVVLALLGLLAIKEHRIARYKAEIEGYQKVLRDQPTAPPR